MPQGQIPETLVVDFLKAGSLEETGMTVQQSATTMYGFQVSRFRLIAFLILLSHLAFSSALRLPGSESTTSYESSINITLPFQNASTPSNVLHLSCDGARFGRDLNVASCRDVFGFLEPNDTQVVFAERNSGIYHDLPLPYRILGSV